MTAVHDAPANLGEQPAPRRDVRSAVAVGALSVLLSIVGALAWGLAAPGYQYSVVDSDHGIELTGESGHVFDGVGLFLCIAAMVGASAVIAAWQWRSRRGPILFAGTLIGTAVGGEVMLQLGNAVARLHHARPARPAAHTVITLPARLDVDSLVWAPTFIAALAIVVLALLSSRDDLGAH
jgi:hypothetical protein